MGIRAKLLVFSLSVVAALVAIFGGFAFELYRIADLQGQEDGILLYARAQMSTVPDQVMGVLSTSDREALETMGDALEREADFHGFAVWDGSGQLLAQAGDISILVEVRESALDAGVRRIGDGIFGAVASVGSHGSVGLTYSVARVRGLRWRLMILAFFVLLIVTVVVAVVFVGVERFRVALLAMRGAAERIAAGDLLQELPAAQASDEVGNMAKAFRKMLSTLRQLVIHIKETSVQIGTASEEIVAAAARQEQGATQQSSAVEETRRTTDSLLRSGRAITDAAQGVLQNAELTQRNNQQVAERIGQLSAHTLRIAEILETIKDIANKSELLALNAALEGTKAGEAGRGFSLVATQMQRLAENVMGSVRNIKTLTEDIGEATSATVLATEEATKLAADTTRSARQISLIIQQQLTGTEQVSEAMEDVAKVAVETAQGNKQTLSATRELTELSQRLLETVHRFEVRPEA